MAGLFGPRARGLFPTHLSTTSSGAVPGEHNVANFDGLFPRTADPDQRRDSLAAVLQGAVQTGWRDQYAYASGGYGPSWSLEFGTFPRSAANPPGAGALHQTEPGQALLRSHKLDANGLAAVSLVSSAREIGLGGMLPREGSIGGPGDALPTNTRPLRDTPFWAGERSRHHSEQWLPELPVQQTYWTEPVHSRQLHHHAQWPEQSVAGNDDSSPNPGSRPTNSHRPQYDLEERARTFSLSPATMDKLDEEAEREAKDIIVIGRRRPPPKAAPTRKPPSTRPQVPAGRVGVQLPRSGPGYRTYGEPQNQFGTPQTVSRLRHISEVWSKQHRTPIQFGHISKRGGGKLYPHKSHKRGIDVDIRPVRADGAALPTTWRDRSYDRRSTLELLRTIRGLYPNTVILFNDPEAIRQGLSKRWANHDNHIHVSFRK